MRFIHFLPFTLRANFAVVAASPFIFRVLNKAASEAAGACFLINLYLMLEFLCT